MQLEELLTFSGLAVTIAGAHFFANAVRARMMRAQKPYAGLVSFIALLASFAAIGAAIVYIIQHAFPFGR